MKYAVYENGQPCVYKEGEHRYWKDWANNRFNTLEGAVRYANSWLGNYVKDHPIEAKSLLEGHTYNGYDSIQIKEIK